MNPQRSATRTRSTAVLAAAILLAVGAPLGLYLAAAWAAADADQSSVLAVGCFEPAKVQQMSAARRTASAAMAVGAVVFLFVVPGLLGTLAFMRLPRTRPTAYAWSLAANSAALILIFLVLRYTCGINRASLLAAWLAWTGVLFALGWQPGRSLTVLGRLGRRYGGGLLIGLLSVLAAVVIFFPEQFLQCFSEDGTETYELARSLRQHFLPYWELETWEAIPGGRLGTVVVNPSLINSYWTCALQGLLGDGELATRLSYWVWWLAIFAVSYRMVRGPGSRVQGSEFRVQESIPTVYRLPSTAYRLASIAYCLPAAAALGLTMLLISVLFTFYVGYNPYMADLANPGVPDALFTLLMLLSFDCLRQKDRPGWVISVTLASLVLYAGAVLLVLTLAAVWWWKLIERRETVRWAFWGVAALTAVVVFYLLFGWIDGSLPFWVDTIDIEYVNDYLSDVPRWKSGPLFAMFFLVGCGGVPAIGLLWALRRSAWERTVATVTLLYLLVVLASGFKNLHYFGPLLPVPVLLFLLAIADFLPAACLQRGKGADRSARVRRQEFVMAASCFPAVISVVVAIWICWPVRRATYTLNRRLGSHTTIAADSYLTAVQWARLRYLMREDGRMAWDCDQHTWAAYAELDAELKAPRRLVLTDGGPPSRAYRLVASGPVAATTRKISLYTRDAGWTRALLAERPKRPLERYPALFTSLADGLYSPHNNLLKDVPRLSWPW